MERQGSGFKKITDAYHVAHNFRAELEPVFYSDVTSFQVTLYNLNYGVKTGSETPVSENVAIESENVAIESENVAIEPENVAIESENAAIEPENVAIEPENVAIESENVAIEAENVAIEPDNVAIEVAIERLAASSNTIRKAQAVFAKVGTDGIFGRSDITAITNDSVTSAGNLITRLKKAGLIKAVSGHGKGKYKFRKANG